MTTQMLNPNMPMERIARSIAARLDDSTQDMPHEITERLRAARVQAVAKRKVEIAQPVTAVASLGGSLALQLGGSDGGLWNRLTSALALVALVAGLFLIADIQDNRRAKELAEIDAELLTDDLPPAAYTDPGFVQFLRSNRAD